MLNFAVVHESDVVLNSFAFGVRAHHVHEAAPASAFEGSFFLIALVEGYVHVEAEVRLFVFDVAADETVRGRDFFVALCREELRLKFV